MVDQAASFIGNIPEHYDRCMGPIFFADFAADMASRVAAIRPRRVLETAAGTGIVARKLRDLLPPDCDLTTTDLNAPMLDVARRKFGAGEKIEFRTADALALPFADGAFDAMVCQFGVMFFPDKAKSYREAHRVLTPGGRYLLSVWDDQRYNPVGRIAHEVIGGHFPSDPPTFFKVPFGYHSIDAVKTALIETDFADLEVFVVTRQVVIPDPLAFARGMVLGSPVFEQITTRNGDPEKIAGAVAEAFRRELGTNPCRTALQAIVFSARKP